MDPSHLGHRCGWINFFGYNHQTERHYEDLNSGVTWRLFDGGVSSLGKLILAMRPANYDEMSQ